MSSGAGDKLKGTVNKVAGKGQEEWGEATGDVNAQAEGEARQTEGTVDQTKGNIKNTADNVGKGIKDTVHDITH